MGWTEGFEPSISRATTWRVDRYATPTTRAEMETPASPRRQRLECTTFAQIRSRKAGPTRYCPTKRGERLPEAQPASDGPYQ
jgi:hypothetical protein